MRQLFHYIYVFCNTKPQLEQCVINEKSISNFVISAIDSVADWLHLHHTALVAVFLATILSSHQHVRLQTTPRDVKQVMRR